MFNFLYSLITFFVALFFILLGIIGAMIPWFPAIRTEVITLILEHSITIFLFGFSFIAIGCALVINILLSVRKDYYHFKVGNHPVQVDENLIQSYLTNYWKELFPENEIPNRLVLKKNKIHVIADLPYMQRPQQEVILERIKNDLRELFGDMLGYRHQFHLSASFQSEKKG
jgi:hypothetical protein